jgi:type I phosphodiesterase/nucleotide pyrophosphatase
VKGPHLPDLACRTEAELLGGCELPVAGLFRSHESQNIGVIASCIVDAYRRQSLIELGPARSLAVLAVDGLGYGLAAQWLAPDVLIPLTTTFPSTTTTALAASLTGRTPSGHGVIGVQYLHPDGARGYNCITGEITEPNSAGAIRPSPDPVTTTAFTTLRDLGIPSFSLPGELAALSAQWRKLALDGSTVVAGSTECGSTGRAGSTGLDGQVPGSGPPGPPGERGVDEIVDAVTRDLREVLDRHRGAPVWAYLNLDDHLHRHGPDHDIERACQAINSLAMALSAEGTAVLLYTDHGCAASRPSAATMAVWDEVSSQRTCRLPAGGAGRARWLYPRIGAAQSVADELRARLPDAVVTSPAELSRWGLVEAGSIGYARLGEVVLLARGPDFPVPEPELAFEHGSLTAQEILVPLAVWQPAR